MAAELSLASADPLLRNFLGRGSGRRALTTTAGNGVRRMPGGFLGGCGTSAAGLAQMPSVMAQLPSVDDPAGVSEMVESEGGGKLGGCGTSVVGRKGGGTLGGCRTSAMDDPAGVGLLSKRYKGGGSLGCCRTSLVDDPGASSAFCSLSAEGGPTKSACCCPGASSVSEGPFSYSLSSVNEGFFSYPLHTWKTPREPI